MRRLVYSPKAYVFIKRRNGTVIDVSKYVVSGSVRRRVNAASDATIVLRNHDMIFSAKHGQHAAFYPMDPITIYLQRLAGHPVRVFTGFLDETPYYEFFPGTIELTATCTIKKLLYTYFDPALPYTQSFLSQYGWIPDPKTGQIFNYDNLTNKMGENDSGMGNLLFKTMEVIGHWRKRDILIEDLPDDLIERMTNLLLTYEKDQKKVRKELNHFIRRFVGAGAYGEDGGAVTTGNIDLRGNTNVQKVFNFLRETVGYTAEQAAGVVGTMMGESGESLDTEATNPKSGAYGIAQWLGGRKTALMARPNPSSLETQLKHLWSELQTTESAAHAAMKRANSISEAVQAWLFEFERPAAWEAAFEKRLSYAKVVYSNFANSPLDQDPLDIRDDFDTTKRRVRREQNSTSNDSSDNPRDRLHTPVKGVTADSWGWSPGVHDGIDLMCPADAVIYAVCKAKVIDVREGGWWGKNPSGNISLGDGIIQLEALEDIGDLKRGYHIGYGHAEKPMVNVGDTVEPGQPIGHAGNANGWHVHFMINDGSTDQGIGTMDPRPFWEAFRDGKAPSGAATGGAAGAIGGDAPTDSILPRANAALLASQFSLATAQEMMEATMLQGNKSFMNDKPLMPFIQQICDGSLRQFQSMPDGSFFAFYPDYFGETFHRPPYWWIDDTEILDGRVKLNDMALVTHQYVVGDTMFANIYGGDDFWNRLNTVGVVSVTNAFVSDMVTSNPDGGDDDEPKKQKKLFTAFNKLLKQDEATEFLERYGVRPNLEDAPMIRNPLYELFLAYQRFLQAWSRQFITPFEFTFMPELYPGGKVGFPTHGLQMYIEEVTHNFDYTTGFTTQAQLSAPAAMVNKEGKPYNANLPLNMPTALLDGR